MNTSPPKRFQGETGASPFQRFAEKSNHIYHPVNTGILRRISEAGDDFLLNDIKVELVTLVCRILSLHEGGQRIDLVLADEFGSFKGVVYRSGDTNPRAFKNYNVGNVDSKEYVSVIGHLRKFQSTAMVLVDLIEPTKSYYDVLSHRASVLWSWCQRTGRSPTKSPLQERSTPMNEVQDELAHLQPMQREIMRIFKKLSIRDANVPKMDVFKELNPRPMEKEFENHITYLNVYGYLMEGQSKDTYTPSP